jgi:hypothetical protein
MASNAALLNKLWESPLGQQLRQDEIEQAKAERQASLDAIPRLEKQALAELPALLAARDKAEQERTAALEYVRTAQAKFNQAFSVHQSRSTHYGSEIARHRLALEQSADPAIDRFLAKLDAEAERLVKLPSEVIHETSLNVRTYGEQITRTNRRSIVDRLAAVRASRVIVEARKYSAVEGEKLLDELAKIWVALPPIGEPK